MKWKAHLALLSVALIYGANYSIAKNVMDQSYLEPNGFILLRVVVGVLLFVVVQQFFIKEKVEKSDLRLLALCGVFGVAINQLCFFKGLELTSPIHASLIMMVTPILVLLIASVYLREKIHWSKALGVVIGMSGAFLLILNGAGGMNDMSSVKGDFYIFVNATSYGLYLVLVKRMMEKYHPITVMKWVFGFGLVVVLPFGAADLMDVDWGSFRSDIWLAVAYVLFFTTFMAYLLSAYALSKVTATTASGYIYLQPLIASGIAILWYNDHLTLSTAIYGFLIFIGVYLISKSRAKLKKNIN